MELQKVMQAMAARVTRSDAAVREAVTALRQGKSKYALEVLEKLERQRAEEGNER